MPPLEGPGVASADKPSTGKSLTATFFARLFDSLLVTLTALFFPSGFVFC